MLSIQLLKNLNVLPNTIVYKDITLFLKGEANSNVGNNYIGRHFRIFILANDDIFSDRARAIITTIDCVVYTRTTFWKLIENGLIRVLK